MNFIKPFVVESINEIRCLIGELGDATMANVITSGKDGKPISSFLPVDFSDSDDGLARACFHLANTNNQLEDLSSQSWALIEYRSPDLYISPSWFVDRNRAPTNVHVVIQCYGEPKLVEEGNRKREILDGQVQARESEGKCPWSSKELQGNGYERRLKLISFFEMQIESAKASVRMLQDESTENVRSVLEHLESDPTTKNKFIVEMIKHANKGRL